VLTRLLHPFEEPFQVLGRSSGEALAEPCRMSLCDQPGQVVGRRNIEPTELRTQRPQNPSCPEPARLHAYSKDGGESNPAARGTYFFNKFLENSITSCYRNSQLTHDLRYAHDRAKGIAPREIQRNDHRVAGIDM
jgi:hypothetical protein